MTILDPFNQLLKEFNNDTTKRLPEKPKLLDHAKYDKDKVFEFVVDYLKDQGDDITRAIQTVCARWDYEENKRDRFRHEIIDMLQKDQDWETYRDEIENLQ